MPKPSLLAALALCAALSGCGTFANILCSSATNPPRPFGGIAADLSCGVSGDPLALLDLPGSTVGDILTLPDVLAANGVFDRTPRAVSTPRGHDPDSEDPTAVLRPNRVAKIDPADPRSTPTRTTDELEPPMDTDQHR